MFDLLITLTPISLVDSLSLLPFATVVLALLLGGPRPYLGSISFLAGTALSYFAAGLLIAWGLGGLIEQVSARLIHRLRNPADIDYYLSVVVGIALIVLGYGWAVARRKRAERRTPSAGMSPLQAFLLGGGATIAGLWGALPYFAAIDQILKADVSTAEGMIALACYNVVFVSLALALVLVRAVAGRRAEAVFDAVNRLFAVWGKRVLIVAMILLGAVMIADGVGWMLGWPILPTGPS